MHLEFTSTLTPNLHEKTSFQATVEHRVYTDVASVFALPGLIKTIASHLPDLGVLKALPLSNRNRDSTGPSPDLLQRLFLNTQTDGMTCFSMTPAFRAAPTQEPWAQKYTSTLA